MESLLELLNQEQGLIDEIRRHDDLIAFWHREIEHIDENDIEMCNRMLERIEEGKNDCLMCLDYVREQLGDYIKKLFQ